MLRAGSAATALTLLAACGAGGRGSDGGGATAPGTDLSATHAKLLLWGPGSGVDRQAQVDLWNQQHPNLPLEFASAPYGGQGIVALQKFIAAVAAGTPADVAWIDRFQIANLAARKAFVSLDPFIKRDKYNLKRHFAPLLEEVHGIDGKVYALPSSTDDRAFWWNTRLVREAGLDAHTGPKIWEELKEYAVRTTRLTGDPGTDQVGWNYRVPGFGIFYLYGWIFGAEFLSKDGRKAQYNHPGVVEALQTMLDIVDAMGGTAKVDGFLNNNKAMSGGGSTTMFVDDRIAAQVPSPLNAIARDRPNMEFGWSHMPLRRAGDKIRTFAGGFSWTVPAGVPHPDVSWALASSLMSEPSLLAWAEAAAAPVRAQGGVYRPGYTSVQDVDRLLRERYATGIASVDKGWDFEIDLMQYARVRPVSPAAADAWDALGELWNSVFSRSATPKQAADLANTKVQKALDDAYATLGR
jgi:multiple sugar transport system permease protein